MKYFKSVFSLILIFALFFAGIFLIYLLRKLPSNQLFFTNNKNNKQTKLIDQRGQEIENSIDFIGNKLVRVNGVLINDGFKELNGYKYISVDLPEIGKVINVYIEKNQKETLLLLLDSNELPMQQIWIPEKINTLENYLKKNKHVRIEALLNEVDYSKYQLNIPNNVDLYFISNIALIK